MKQFKSQSGVQRTLNRGGWMLPALLTVLPACSDLPTTPPENGSAPTSIAVSEQAVLLEALTEGRTLSVETKDARGRTVQAPVTWISDNPAVVEVDASGRIRAAANGATRVRVRTQAVGGVGASDPAYRASALEAGVDVIVYQRAAQVQVLGAPAPLRSIGARSQLSVQVRDPAGALLQRPFVTVWTSETPGVVRVNAAGEVSAVEDGVGLVRARVEDASNAITLEVNATLRYSACAGSGLADVAAAQNFLAVASATGCGSLPLLRRNGVSATGGDGEG